MSMKADIDLIFDEIISKHPDLEEDLLVCKFGVYESLEWDDSAGEVVKNIIDKGFCVDGNMRSYL